VRLAAILPAYFPGELLLVVRGAPRVAPHSLVPLQSASDRVLRLMRRPYNVRMYRAIVEQLAARVSDAGIGADVIVGFPGETEHDFADTVSLVEALPFSYLHVFAYSDRAGTEATRLPDRVPDRTIARRSEILRERSAKKAWQFRERLVGQTVEALVLETRDRATGRLVGLTGSYVEVVFDGPAALVRELVRVRVTEAGAERAKGEVA
jgi:threonylcarbamoyladenosine tRNA methylthiotransferase MtaB